MGCTPPESTLPSLPPPTPTVSSPLLSAPLSPLWCLTSPPLWSALTFPPLWCPMLPPLSTLESTPDSPPSTAPTTATTTASARLRLSPTQLARSTDTTSDTPTLATATLDTLTTTATATPATPATTTDKSFKRTGNQK